MSIAKYLPDAINISDVITDNEICLAKLLPDSRKISGITLTESIVHRFLKRHLFLYCIQIILFSTLV